MDVEVFDGLSSRELRMLELDIFSYELDGKKPSENKVLAIIGGQPASGKSLLLEKLSGELGSEHTVVINGDELRRYHPNYRHWAKSDDKTVADKTQPFANHMCNHLKREALLRGLNVVIEGTMRDAKISVSTAKEFAAMGYRVGAHIMAVTGERSILGVHKRYEAQKLLHGHGRFTQEGIHDQSYFAVPRTADILYELPEVHEIKVYNYKGDNIYENYRKPSIKWSVKNYDTEWSMPVEPSIAINEERRRDLSWNEKVEIARDWSLIVALQHSRGVVNDFCERNLERVKSTYVSEENVFGSKRTVGARIGL